MLEAFGISNDALIVVISALAAAISFAVFALPLLNRSEKKKHYQNVISKKRRELFDATKEGQDRKIITQDMTAAESMAAFYKFQKLAGDMGEKVRTQLLQAGMRDPKAPMYYILARIFLPVFLLGFGMLILSKVEKEISEGITLMVLLGLAFFGFMVPKLLVKNTAIKRSEEINLAFPDALDMMLICVQGGIGLEQTVNRIADECGEFSEMLAEELGILAAEMAMLNDRKAALQDFAKRIGGGSARSFSTAVIQAEQYGTSVTNALRVMSEELREERMAKAEEKAASLPPKLTVPMILFFLPALFIVILGPAVIQAGMAGM